MKTDEPQRPEANDAALNSRSSRSAGWVDQEELVKHINAFMDELKWCNEHGIKSMLEAHIEWGKQVFPFITANGKGQL